MMEGIVGCRLHITTRAGQVMRRRRNKLRLAFVCNGVVNFQGILILSSFIDGFVNP